MGGVILSKHQNTSPSDADLPAFEFLVCFPVGSFFVGFRLACCRGVGVGCEAPHLRPIIRILPMGLLIRSLYPPDFLCIFIYGLSGWASVVVSQYPSRSCYGGRSVPFKRGATLAFLSEDIRARQEVRCQLPRVMNTTRGVLHSSSTGPSRIASWKSRTATTATSTL